MSFYADLINGAAFLVSFSAAGKRNSPVGAITDAFDFDL